VVGVAPGEALGVGEDGFSEAGAEGGRARPLSVLFAYLSEGDDLCVDEALQGLDVVAALQEALFVSGEATLSLQRRAVVAGRGGTADEQTVDLARQVPCVTALAVCATSPTSWGQDVRNRREISSDLLETKRSTRSCWRVSSAYRSSSKRRSEASWWPGMGMHVAWSRVVWTLMWCLSEL
jgi:hypothetical protein